VRLNNNSQLAGFTKRDNLSYFLKQLNGAEYSHMLILAPTKEILNDYKKKKITWKEYEKQFNALLDEREVDKAVNRELFDVPTVLLCSEPQAEHCHRRLVAEYLKKKWRGANIFHL
jgi:uncharacterized protein YeaO (DUF488 family)